MKKANQIKVSTRTKIYALLDRSVKPKEIAKQLNIPVQSVYSAKYLRFKDAPKRRSSKERTMSEKLKKAWEKSRPANVLQQQSQLLAKTMLEDEVDALKIEIANLKHQIIGFRAVISYLEDLSGIRDSQ